MYERCEKGEFRPENMSNCQRCPKGEYRNNTDADTAGSCTACPTDTTTIVKGATECVAQCPSGKGFNISMADQPGKDDPALACFDCPLNQFRPASSESAYCQFCPSGQLTVAVGSLACEETQLTPVLGTVQVVVIVVIEINACSQTDHFKSVIQTQLLSLIIAKREFYPDLCPSTDCSNINIDASDICSASESRRKREILQNQTADVNVTVSGVSPVVRDLRYST